MTDPLFAALPGPIGALRRLLDARVAELQAAGNTLEPDLVLLVRSLADRIDTANATNAYRGFVMLTAEYRAARRDLFDGADDGAADPLQVALADFRAAAAGHPTDTVPGH
jgi:hypothetical protein